jgi:hypothetical protein
MDLRLRIVRAVERGSSIREAARRFAVSPSAVIMLMQRCYGVRAGLSTIHNRLRRIGLRHQKRVPVSGRAAGACRRRRVGYRRRSGSRTSPALTPSYDGNASPSPWT